MIDLEKLAETRPEALARALSKKRSAGTTDVLAEAFLHVGGDLAAAIRDVGAELRKLRTALAGANAAGTEPSTARLAVANALCALFDVEALSDLEAPAGELLERIRAHATYRDRSSVLWPRNARSLSVALKSLREELASRGFTVEQGAGDHRRTWSIRRKGATRLLGPEGSECEQT